MRLTGDDGPHVSRRYPYCNRPDPANRTVLSLACLDKLRVAAESVGSVARRHGLTAWAGEGSNLWDGGVANVSDVFLDGFYYAMQLSTMSTPRSYLRDHISVDDISPKST